MIRTRLFLAALLALAPSPALADVTARYAASGKELVVEVDEGGNSRVEIAGKFAIIHRDGTDYIVVYEKAGPKVFELQAMVDLFKGFLPKATPEEGKNMRFDLAPGAALAIAGQQGAVWKLVLAEGPADTKKRYIEMVASADPRLAPVGDVFRRAIATFSQFAGGMFPAETGFSARLADLFAKGTPLRIVPVEEGAAKPDGPLIEFTALDTAEIDAKHFELPVPVTPAEEIFGALDTLMKPEAGIEKLP